MPSISKKLLLCTDMDRTVIPNGIQIEAEGARQKFSEFCQQPHITLSYVTGRHLALMLQAVAEYSLPIPDYAITDVGTRIYQFKAGQWQVLDEWNRALDANWQDVDAQQIINELSMVDVLSLQEAEKQNAHKISFYVDLQKTNEVECLQRVEKALQPLNIKSNLIWSIDETTNTGLLDILPSNADKLHAIDFLKNLLKFSSNEVVFAGDSGNDLPVLESSIQAVLVANATQELQQQALYQSIKLGNEAYFYQAKNASEKEAGGNYSAGILQGVFHYRPDLE